MNSLQLPPVTGVQSPGPSPSGTAAGNESSTSHVTEQAPKPQPPSRPANPPPISQVNAAQQAQVDAARAADVARVETPAFALQVGVIHPSFQVYVDAVDTASHRVIARVYGPRGQVTEPAPIRHLVAKV